MEAIGAAAFVVGILVAKYAPRLVAATRHRWQQRHDTVECTGCGRPIPTTRAVTIGETWDAHDGGWGGTGVSTDWHRRCLRKARANDVE